MLKYHQEEKPAVKAVSKQNSKKNATEVKGPKKLFRLFSKKDKSQASI